VGSYYYLVAQLPSISYGAPPIMGSTQFKELARDLLTGADAELLESCALDPEPMSVIQEGSDVLPTYSELLTPTGSALIDQWRIWERALRLNLAKLRAQKLKKDSLHLAEVPSDPLDAGAIARAALAIESPLEAEIFLDRSRWDVVGRPPRPWRPH